MIHLCVSWVLNQWERIVPLWSKHHLVEKGNRMGKMTKKSTWFKCYFLMFPLCVFRHSHDEFPSTHLELDCFEKSLRQTSRNGMKCIDVRAKKTGCASGWFLTLQHLSHRINYTPFDPSHHAWTHETQSTFQLERIWPLITILVMSSWIETFQLLNMRRFPLLIYISPLVLL